MKLQTRQTYTQNTVNKFLNKPYKWGTTDCAHLAASHVSQTGKPTPLDEARSYKTAKGALRSIRELGFDSLEDLMDKTYQRIAPAMALAGDIVALPAEDGWIALGIYLGEQRLLAFVDRSDGQGACCYIGPVQVATHAWRLED